MDDNDLRKALDDASRERIRAVLQMALLEMMAAGPLQPDDAPALAAAVEQWLGEDGGEGLT